jgi:general secretion pathway protein M
MINMQRVETYLARFPTAAVAAYFALIVAFVFVTADSALQILQRRDAVAAAGEILDRLQVRGSVAPALRTDVSVPAGSAFLEGPSASIAGAELLQRVAVAAKRLGGNVRSSQVDLQGPESKAGFIRVTASFDIEPHRLQPLLYDLEAGMPFLFVDELVVQAPPAASKDGRLQVLLGVSGRRQGSK